MPRTHLIDKDLIEEILAKLPAKSLMRFKALSKIYNRLITCKNFIKKHFSHSIMATKNHPNLLVFHFTDKFCITLVFDDEQPQPPIDLISQFPFPNNVCLDSIIAYGPCNGIFCIEVSILHSPDQLMLWNSATREIKLLPLPLVVDSFMWSELTIVHGFGFNSETNDYVVVNIVSGEEYEDEGPPHPYAQVYELSTNAWRMVEISFPANNLANPIFTSYLNGVYHWLAKSHNVEFILCFGMSNNRFWKMKLPLVIEESTNHRLVDYNLTILNDCIAYVKEYISFSEERHHFDVWLMNQYGVEESWTRRFRVGPFQESWKFWGFWKDDEVFLVEQDRNILVSYNFHTQQQVRVFPVNVENLSHLYRYEESMVSLSN